MIFKRDTIFIDKNDRIEVTKAGDKIIIMFENADLKVEMTREKVKELMEVMNNAERRHA